MIEVDRRKYNVGVTDVGLDVEFMYKFAERTENFDLQYELGAVFFNQSLTFSMESTENKDFKDLFSLLSTKSEIDKGTGHNVTIWTPLGKMAFLMYPNRLSLSLRMEEHSRGSSWWSGFTVKFIAVKPVESW